LRSFWKSAELSIVRRSARDQCEQQSLVRHDLPETTVVINQEYKWESSIQTREVFPSTSSGRDLDESKSGRMKLRS
jgi:hypothetical protein